jgi:hypothetical protein
MGGTFFAVSMAVANLAVNMEGNSLIGPTELE